MSAGNPAPRVRPAARNGVAALPPSALRWRCDPKALGFDSTADVEPAVGVVGQDAALDAMEFGLQTNAPGQNIYVRGLTGTGRQTLVRRMLETIPLSRPLTKDCCYVHNFTQPGRPRLIELPPGRGRDFRRRIDRLIDFVRDDLAGALDSEHLRARRSDLEQHAEEQLQTIINPFEAALRAAGLTLVRLQAGPVVQTVIHPLVDGQAVAPEAFEQLHTEGKVTDAQYQAVHGQLAQFEQQLQDIGTQVAHIRSKLNEEGQSLVEGAARLILGEYLRAIHDVFPVESARIFLAEVVDDVIGHLSELGKEPGFVELYRVNVLSAHDAPGACPIVVESSPTFRNLFGSIEYHFAGSDEVRVTHMGIAAGSLLRADGGFLILEVRDVIGEPGVWRALTRTLRNRRLEIAPSEGGMLWMAPALQPEPIEINVKVVLLGDSETYYLLDSVDPDFGQLFKVLADFDTFMPRNDQALRHYSAILARIVADEQLPPFDRAAVAAWIEHGARIAARRDRLSARFGRLADIAREAAFLARAEQRPRVTGDDVRSAVRRSKRRADLPSRRFREYIADGTIRIETRGRTVGQVNGLAVLQMGLLTYGFPARISATIGPGTAGVINIEREAALSGAIHTKGFYILGGLLRYLLRTDHPLAFDASVAFEQSYGGIDGDSASGAEICCLLSALTDVPLRQDLAMTGAIDQMGHILAIGAVNEKIEGFYDACSDLGLTGTQGVIIPKSNAGDLMLRTDVVDACAAGKFHVYAAERVHDALELFTGLPAGQRGSDGRYPAGTLLAHAVDRARGYWEKVIQAAGSASPSRPAPVEPSSDE